MAYNKNQNNKYENIQSDLCESFREKNNGQGKKRPGGKLMINVKNMVP